MSLASKDEEVRGVVEELDALIAQLRANVQALNEILIPPPADTPGQEVPVS